MNNNIVLDVNVMSAFATGGGELQFKQARPLDDLRRIRLVLHFLKRVYELGAFVSEVKGNILGWRIAFHPDGDPRTFTAGKDRSLVTAELCFCVNEDDAQSLYVFDNKYQLRSQMDIEAVLIKHAHRFSLVSRATVSCPPV